jgi:NAD(P)H-nitrite reductase large subunit
VVIGAGLIGAACADALTRAGHHPTVVELRDRPLNLLLDEPGSELVRRAMVKVGIDLICNATVTDVLGGSDDDRVVGGVLLSTGRRIECDTLIVAVGVRPRMQLAIDAGIRTNRGIVVDQQMATSAPGIYACGDVAEAYDPIFGGNRVVPIWPGAYRGGRVAGHNMAGHRAAFDDQTTMNTIKYFGLSLVSAGEINPAPDSGCEVLSAVDLDRGWYRKLVLRDNCLIGFVIAGAIERSGVLYWLLQARVPTASFRQRMLNDDFDLIHIPAELRRAHYLEATANPAQTRMAWGAPVTVGKPASANGGKNGAH